MESQQFKSFQEFYPFYLGEHKNLVCRRLHFIGTALVILIFLAALTTGRWSLAWWMPVAGYGFAWVGHFFFEKNRPASFQHPLYSLMGDFAMFGSILIGRIPF